ncbi:hypothetical protein Pla163_34420 [Planctomycetes bacterium Pla163]|uniref:Uncharacterized protein n=1 Tax=Rohdeia mirabilis TaxID=2528008 RepID=A0A518D492_9BACT|nr:hypothetical protein Pla163_34420 [Planctomycetes bacterium Pla163]
MRAHHLRVLASAVLSIAATGSSVLASHSPLEPTALQEDSVRGARPVGESPLDVDRVIALAAPTARDLVHRQVEWHGSVIDGVLAAQAADKPLLLWLYFGGPLGDC